MKTSLLTTFLLAGAAGALAGCGFRGLEFEGVEDAITQTLKPTP